MLMLTVDLGLPVRCGVQETPWDAGERFTVRQMCCSEVFLP